VFTTALLNLVVAFTPALLSAFVAKKGRIVSRGNGAEEK
jgi:hypothetical protein